MKVFAALLAELRVYRGMKTAHSDEYAARNIQWFHSNPKIASTYSKGHHEEYPEGAHVNQHDIDTKDFLHVDAHNKKHNNIPIHKIKHAGVRQWFETRPHAERNAHNVTTAAREHGFKGVHFHRMRDSYRNGGKPGDIVSKLPK